MLLRTQKAAERLGVTTGFLRRLVRQGRIKVVQQTARSPFFFAVADLNAWLEKAKKRAQQN